MYRPFALALGPVLSSLGLLGLFGAVAPTQAQAQTQPVVPQATITPDRAPRQLQTSPEAIMATLMMEPGTRKVAAPATAVKVASESESPHNWRMVVAALLLMAAIALRRRRSRP